MKKSPFKFLDSYSKDDRNIFFGRDKEIEELYSRVFESKILVVYGTSGTGKSSLINCGLANKFNDSDWLPVSVRRGNNINTSFYESLLKVSLTPVQKGKVNSQTGNDYDVPKILRSVYLDHFKPVYLIFDQFEELFIFGSASEKEELINIVSKIIDSDLQCRMIFSIREEYLAGITEFERVIPTFLSNRIRIEKMTRQNAVRVIEGPCGIHGIALEKGFAEALIEKLNPESPEVELTYLQVYLDRIFRMSLSESKEDTVNITIDLLEKAGDVKDLLGAFLEEQISQLDDPELGMIVLKSFVSVKGTRHQITEEEALGYIKTLGRDIVMEDVRNLLQTFIRLRILRDKDENNRYELRHDSLASKIYENITLVEKELLELRLFIDNAYNNFEKRELYLTADDLKYIAPYEDKLFLNEKLTKYIAQSKKEIHRAKRRRQNAMVISAAVLIAILGFFSIWAVRERANALDQTKIADEQRNSAIREKEAAESARQDAVAARNLAMEKEAIAVKAQEQSEAARKEALAERENALQQRNRAEQLSIEANEQAQIAREEKNNADLEREKAVLAEERAMRLNLLSVAQNLALKSIAVENDPELSGLLAAQAYKFNIENGGRMEDPIIYDALNRAYSILDNWRHSVLAGYTTETRTLAESGETMLGAGLDGVVRSLNIDDESKTIFAEPASSPIDFVTSGISGKYFLCQHDNGDLNLIDLGDGKFTDDIQVLQIYGHDKPVRNAVFSGKNQLIATSGADSLILISAVESRAVVEKYRLKAGEQVTAMTFAGEDSLFFSTSDGRINLWNLPDSDVKCIYESETDEALSLAWNSCRKILLAGSVNGNLLSFTITGMNQIETRKNVVHTAGIDLLVFNNDFSYFATSSWDKTIKYYNFHEFFELGNTVGGVVHIKDLNLRVRSMMFTKDNALVAGLSDRSVRLWETSSGKLSEMICSLVHRDMTEDEWEEMVGSEIPYETSCDNRK